MEILTHYIIFHNKKAKAFVHLDPHSFVKAVLLFFEAFFFFAVFFFICKQTAEITRR